MSDAAQIWQGPGWLTAREDMAVAQRGLDRLTALCEPPANADSAALAERVRRAEGELPAVLAAAEAALGADPALRDVAQAMTGPADDSARLRALLLATSRLSLALVKADAASGGAA